jgi:hypothetical protein
MGGGITWPAGLVSKLTSTHTLDLQLCTMVVS